MDFDQKRGLVFPKNAEITPAPAVDLGEDQYPKNATENQTHTRRNAAASCARRCQITATQGFKEKSHRPHTTQGLKEKYHRPQKGGSEITPKRG